MGPSGLPGSAGTNGTAGVKGDTGAAGTKGDTGAKGDSGAAGSSFSARSVCGSDGGTLCAVGMQGPGGGTVFFVDTEGRYSDFDYLEVAPEDAATGVAWSTTTPHCGLLANTSCQAAFVTTSGEAINYGAIGTGRAATAAIVARHDVGGVAKTDYAAGVADAYTTPTASDWWLPSFEELREVCKFALNVPPDETDCGAFEGPPTLRSGFFPRDYWSSSEWTVRSSGTAAWIQAFSEGSYGSSGKSNSTKSVRPVRGF